MLPMGVDLVRTILMISYGFYSEHWIFTWPDNEVNIAA